MFKEFFKTIDMTIEAYKNLKTFFISVANGEYKNRDAEINKRFQQYESNSALAPEVFGSKLESLVHSQGVTGFVGTGHNGAGKAQIEKRHNTTRNH